MDTEREQMIEELNFVEKSIIQSEHRTRMIKMTTGLGLMMIIIILLNL